MMSSTRCVRSEKVRRGRSRRFTTTTNVNTPLRSTNSAVLSKFAFGEELEHRGRRGRIQHGRRRERLRARIAAGANAIGSSLEIVHRMPQFDARSQQQPVGARRTEG